MNDIFIFRVYDTMLEEMGQQFIKYVVAEDGTKFKMIAFKFSHGIKTLAECLSDSTFDVMQSTGLQDANGKLIFRGDVIEFSVKNSGDENSYLPVIYEPPKFLCQSIDGRMEIDKFLEWDRGNRAIKIVGNIYENPELIRK